MLKEHDEDYTASEKQVMKARTEVEEVSVIAFGRFQY